MHHVDNTAGKWEPWSESVSRKVSVQSTLEANLLKLRTPQFPFGGPESAVRMLTFSGTTPASPTPSARDRELGQQRPCTEENDRAAFHVLVQAIDDSPDSIGESLLLTISHLFENDESGHKLFRHLEKRANGSDQGGLVDADDIKRQIEEYKFCECKEITVEELALGSEKFERMWLRQPAARQGIGGDMFDKWVTKLPEKPFHVALLPVIKGMNIVQGGSVYANYSQMNQSLRAIYADYLKTNSPVKGVSPAAALVGGPGSGTGNGYKGKGGGGKGGGGKGKGSFPRGGFYCFRCWQKDDHLSGQCSSPPGVCTSCGLDSGKFRLSCGGEQDPKKCIIKGYMARQANSVDLLASHSHIVEQLRRGDEGVRAEE